MSNRASILLLVLVMGLLLPTAVSRALLTLSLAEGVGADTAVAPHDNPIPQGADLITDWYNQGSQSLHKGTGIISYYNLAVFGQNTCTAFGDPYSPLNSPWAPGPYTYHYRIRIPASYPHNIVRVEIFDPDSINADNPGPFTITRTQAAIAAGLPVTTTASCSTTQRDNCVLDTGELQLVISNALTLADINPYYFWRVDENRGQGTPPGNGNCAEPTAYNAGYNTRTLFELLYFAQEPDGSILRQDLAHYTGQVGDGARDTGDHNTDRRWVSPGASPSYDQPIFVPVDPGSPGDFEIDLTTEAPNIMVDPDTGDRYLYFNVTAQDGASENSFDIWAGPPIYTATVPGEVNARNLLALNSPDSHSAKGVEVTAITNLLLNNYYHFLLDIPLVALDVPYAGSDVNVTVFDIDHGGASPITITLDTIPPGDWSLVFGQPGVPDPDGGVRNCLPGLGNCNNQFVTPPYTITMPTETDCDYTNPDPQTCTPFYGGMLTVRYRSGTLLDSYYDTFLWQVTLPTPPPVADPTVGCSAFPIIIHEGARSVHQTLYEAITGSPNFYPQPAPPYSSFINHRPNVPLRGPVHAGDMFLVQNGVEPGGFGWLRWNQYISDNSSNLERSLTWPGNSKDYVTVAAGGQEPPNPPFPHGVYGYIEYNDPYDTSMHIDDWVMASTGAVVSNAVRDILEGHIDLGRVLRLPVYYATAGTGSTLRYQMSGFALFRVAGYQLSSNGSYLLLEFIRWDESCGQAGVAPQDVTINGPIVGDVNTSYAFTATVSPLDATQPITYVWEADGQPTITHTGGITDVISLSWPLTGTYGLTVTAVNPHGGPVSDTHVIAIPPPPDPPPTPGSTPTIAPTNTPTPEPTPTDEPPPPCAVRFAHYVLDTHNTIWITGVVGSDVEVRDVTIGGQLIASGVLEEGGTFQCPGFAGLPVDPDDLIVGHVLVVENLTDGTTDVTIVLGTPPTSTPTPTPMGGYIYVLPDCGWPASDPGDVTFTVYFVNWAINRSLTLNWDGVNIAYWPANGHPGTFSETFTRSLPQTVTTYVVTAVGGAGSGEYSVYFTTPCDNQTPTPTLTPSPTPTDTPTPTNTFTPTPTDTPTPTPSHTPTPTLTPSSTVTATAVPPTYRLYLPLIYK